jgi:hypothetical protein
MFDLVSEGPEILALNRSKMRFRRPHR